MDDGGWLADRAVGDSWGARGDGDLLGRVVGQGALGSNAGGGGGWGWSVDLSCWADGGGGIDDLGNLADWAVGDRWCAREDGGGGGCQDGGGNQSIIVASRGDGDDCGEGEN